jgi:hypothetical protein
MRNLSRLAFLLLLSTAAPGPARADEPPAATNAAPTVSLVLELKDGSLVKGTPEIDTVEIVTSYARMKLPLRNVDVIENKGEEVQVRLFNGDQLKGAMALPELKLTTLFGEAAISANLVERLLVEVQGGPEPASLKKGLVLHFAFDREGEQVQDKSGKQNHGAVKGPVFKREARRRGVLFLDGEGDRVEVANSASLELTKALTLSSWIKLKTFGPGGYGNEYGFVISKGRAIGINNTWILGYAKGSGASKPRRPAMPGPYPVVFHAGGTVRDKLLRSKTKLATGKWYHVVGTYDGTTSRLYINGKLDAEMAKKTKVRSDRAPILIGGSNLSAATFGNHFTVDGSLDELRIYNRALSKDEVHRLYQATR